uniref:Carbonic anhydrase n=1 Tax=Bactrocera dorsalis TaxID=27457 RepID=A0A034WPA1_BACDO
MVLRKPLLLFLQLLAARQIADQSAPQWDYRDTNRWIADYPTCGGSQQSPINLDHYTSIGSLKPALKFRNYAQPFAGRLTLVNNGHTADIVLPETIRGPRPTITGGLLDGVYEAQSVHFHWGAPGGARGSEHTVNGYRYDVEIHIVHKNMKYGNAQEAMQHPDGLAVLAVMINIVDIPQTYYPGLNIVFNSLPRVRAANTNTTIINQLSLNHFLGDVDTRNFFAYRGSLTTPPCSEAVTWHVFPRPLLISREMIQRFFELRQTNGAPLWNNYRPLQTLNRRQVYRRKGGI